MLGIIESVKISMFLFIFTLSTTVFGNLTTFSEKYVFFIKIKSNKRKIELEDSSTVQRKSIKKYLIFFSSVYQSKKMTSPNIITEKNGCFSFDSYL